MQVLAKSWKSWQYSLKLNVYPWLSHLISCVKLDKLTELNLKLWFPHVLNDDNLRKVLLRLKEITSENTYLLPPPSSHVALCIFIAFITM